MEGVQGEDSDSLALVNMKQAVNFYLYKTIVVDSETRSKKVHPCHVVNFHNPHMDQDR